MHSSRMHTACLRIVLGGEVMSRGEGGVVQGEVLSRRGRCCDLVPGEGVVVTWSRWGWGGRKVLSWGRCCDLVPGGGRCCDLVPGGREGGVVQGVVDVVDLWCCTPHPLRFATRAVKTSMFLCPQSYGA